MINQSQGTTFGYVRFSTLDGDRRKLTIEVPEYKNAFLTSIPENEAPSIGSWVKFSGVRRMNKRDLEGFTYYHDPHDGTDKSEWKAFNLILNSLIEIKNYEAFTSAKKCFASYGKILNGWPESLNLEKMKEIEENSKRFFSLMKDMEISKKSTVAIDLNLDV